MKDEKKHQKILQAAVRVFAEKGAAIVIDENILSANVFKDNISELFRDKEKLKRLGEAAKRLSSPDASAKLAKEVLSLSGK